MYCKLIIKLSRLFFFNSKRECNKLRTATPVPDRGLDSLALFACELGCWNFKAGRPFPFRRLQSLCTRCVDRGKSSRLCEWFDLARSKSSEIFFLWMKSSWLIRWTWIGRLIAHIAGVMHVLLAAWMMSRAAKYSRKRKSNYKSPNKDNKENWSYAALIIKLFKEEQKHLICKSCTYIFFVEIYQILI